jgi:hypothetical protein
MSVDLPEPDGPMIAVNVPGANATSTPRRASTAELPAPNRLTSPWPRTTAGPAGASATTWRGVVVSGCAVMTLTLAHGGCGFDRGTHPFGMRADYGDGPGIVPSGAPVFRPGAPPPGAQAVPAWPPGPPAACPNDATPGRSAAREQFTHVACSQRAAPGCPPDTATPWKPLSRDAGLVG